LRIDEAVELQADVMRDLYRHMGEGGAERLICRAMEDLAVRLADIEAQYWKGELDDVAKGCRCLIAIAQQIGLYGLADSSRSAGECAVRGDPVSVAATIARMLRVGDKSLSTVWELQDIIV
jgi:hypothetical protein